MPVGFSTYLDLLRLAAALVVPYWSLSYEVWYYALFAGAHFAQGRGGLLLTGGLLPLVGPRLWLLPPVWPLGSAVYHLQRHIDLPRISARVALAGSLLVIVAFKAAHLDDALNARASA